MKKYKKVYIEITNICNLNCNFCPKTKRKLEKMTIQQFEFIANTIREYTDFIYLHVMGEPLLHENLKDFLEIANKYKLKVVITTNALLIKQKEDILLNSQALHMVNISLHSFEANTIQMSFEEYINNIINYSKKASLKNKITSLRLWNQNGLDTIGCNSLNDNIILELENKFNLSYKILDVFKTKNNATLSNLTYIEKAEKFDWPDINKNNINENHFCYGLRNHIAILVDGTVVPCCLDHEGDIALGNIFKSNIKEIINCVKAKNIYKGFTQRKAIEELCKKCGYAKNL